MLSEFKTKDFVFQGRDAKIVYPPCPANGKLVLKTEYFAAFPFFEVAMLKRGYTLCFVSHPTRWAPDSETKVMAEFVRFVAAELGFEPAIEYTLKDPAFVPGLFDEKRLV